MRLIKNLFVFVFVFQALSSCSQHQSTDHQESEKTPNEKIAVHANNESNLSISGMVCQMGCAGLIEKELNNMQGVADAKVVFDDSIAVISYDDQLVTENDLIEKINSIADHQYKANSLTITSEE